MELFENGIGRPTNEILKKRRNFKIAIISIALVVAVAGIFAVRSFLSTGIDGTEKNATIGCSFPYSRSKCSGVQNDTVKKVQEMLNSKLKYRKKLTVNGVFDSATEKNLKYYQAMNFIAMTGKINAKTLEKLAKATKTEYYKIKYDKNGGKGTLDWSDNNVQVILKGCNQTLSTTKLTKTNQEHIGWTIESNGVKSLGANTSTLSLKASQTIKATAYYNSTSSSGTTSNTSGTLLSSKGTVNITETTAAKNKLSNPVYITSNKYWSVGFNGYSVNTKVISNGTKYANSAVATYHIKGILGQKPNVNDISKYTSNNEPAYSNMGYTKYTTNNYQDLLQTMYNEIINGYPVPIKVKNAPGNEIYVIAYGLKSTDIRTSGKLSANDIAVFDTSGGAWFALGAFKECTVSGKYVIGIPNLSSAPAVNVSEANIANNTVAKNNGLWFNSNDKALLISFNNSSNGYVTSKAPTTSSKYNGTTVVKDALALYHIDGILGRKLNDNNFNTSSNNTTYLNANKTVNFTKIGYRYTSYSTYQSYITTIYNNLTKGYPVAIKVRDAQGNPIYVVAYGFKASKSQRGTRQNGSIPASDIFVINSTNHAWTNLGSFRPYRESNGTYSLGIPIACNTKQYYDKVSGTCKNNPVASSNKLSQKAAVSITERDEPYISGKNKSGNNYYTYVNSNKYWSVRFVNSLDSTKASGNYYDGAVAVYHMQRILGFNFVGKNSGGANKSYLTPSTNAKKTYFVTNVGTNFDIIGYKYYDNYDYNSYIKAVYEEIMRGYPIALKVKKNGKAIYVVAYAVKHKSIRTSGKLSASDIAVIDPTVSNGWSNLGNFEEYIQNGKYVLAKHHILASAQKIYKHANESRTYNCVNGSVENVWNSSHLCCTDIVRWVLWDTGITSERYLSGGVGTLGNEIKAIKVNGKAAFKAIPGSGESDAYSKLKPGDLVQFGNYHFQIYDDNKYMYNSGSEMYKQVQHQVYGPPGSYTIYRLTY